MALWTSDSDPARRPDTPIAEWSSSSFSGGVKPGIYDLAGAANDQVRGLVDLKAKAKGGRRGAFPPYGLSFYFILGEGAAAIFY
jgi:hypothetical protein